MHIESPLLFTALEAMAFIPPMVWYYRNCRRFPHAGLLLALVPLFFAWRSLWNYFYYVDIMLLAAILIDYSQARAESGGEHWHSVSESAINIQSPKMNAN